MDFVFAAKWNLISDGAILIVKNVNSIFRITFPFLQALWGKFFCYSWGILYDFWKVWVYIKLSLQNNFQNIFWSFQLLEMDFNFELFFSLIPWSVQILILGYYSYFLWFDFYNPQYNRN